MSCRVRKLQDEKGVFKAKECKLEAKGGVLEDEDGVVQDEKFVFQAMEGV